MSAAGLTLHNISKHMPGHPPPPLAGPGAGRGRERGAGGAGAGGGGGRTYLWLSAAMKPRIFSCRSITVW